MHETTGRGGPLASTESSRALGQVGPGTRNAGRLHGWTIAISISALMWAVVIGTVWVVVDALT